MPRVEVWASSNCRAVFRERLRGIWLLFGSVLWAHEQFHSDLLRSFRIWGSGIRDQCKGSRCFGGFLGLRDSGCAFRAWCSGVVVVIVVGFSAFEMCCLVGGVALSFQGLGQ